MQDKPNTCRNDWPFLAPYNNFKCGNLFVDVPLRFPWISLSISVWLSLPSKCFVSNCPSLWWNHIWAERVIPEKQKVLGFYVFKSSPYSMIEWGGKMKDQFLCLELGQNLRCNLYFQAVEPAEAETVLGFFPTWLLPFFVLLSAPNFSPREPP